VAQGYGFVPFETVGIYWNAQTLLGKVTANVDGTFTGSAALTFTVPAGAPPSVNQVKGVGGGTSRVIAEASFTVQ
jgi:hypothetical protein